MKTASKVLNIIGLILAIIGIIAGPILIIANRDYANASSYDEAGLKAYWFTYGIGWTIQSALALIICPVTLKSLSDESKKTSVGVMDLLLGSLLGGIFYLCWKPIEYVGPSKTSENNDGFINIYNFNQGNPKYSIGDIVITKIMLIGANNYQINAASKCRIVDYSNTLNKYKLEAIEMSNHETVWCNEGAFRVANGEETKETLRDDSQDKKILSEIEKADAIKKYKELLDSGIITQKEFDKKKKELLDL